MDVDFAEKLRFLLLAYPILLLAFVAHEWAHAYAALKQGDSTAAMLGRLTFNPVKHVELFGSVILPILTTFFFFAPFGWAKPVPVTPKNFRNYKRGDIIVSLAGVTANLVLALACTLLFIPTGLLGQGVPATQDSLRIAQTMLGLGVFINLWLIVINLLPIPGLDGSHVLKHFLPPAIAHKYQQYAAYAFIFLVALSWIGALGFLVVPVVFTRDLLMGSVDQFILSRAAGGL